MSVMTKCQAIPEQEPDKDAESIRLTCCAQIGLMLHSDTLLCHYIDSICKGEIREARRLMSLIRQIRCGREELGGAEGGTRWRDSQPRLRKRRGYNIPCDGR